MTNSIVGPCPPKDEPPACCGVLLALLASWGITLRLVLVICILSAVVVVIVALVVIYLGAVGVGAVLSCCCCATAYRVIDNPEVSASA